MSARQLQVLAEVIVHGSRKEAATCLGVRENTVKKHLQAVLASVDASNAPQAAHRLGWVQLPDDVLRHEGAT